jgi:hypothetical protein
MPRVTLTYKTYDWKFPKEISETDFWYLKEHVEEKKLSELLCTRMQFFKEFWWELTLITLGLVSMALMIYDSFPFLEYLYIILLLIGALSLISFIVSFVNFIDNHFEQVAYFKLLRTSIKNTDNYLTFCKKMEKRDFRYGRIINQNQN